MRKKHNVTKKAAKCGIRCYVRDGRLFRIEGMEVE